MTTEGGKRFRLGGKRFSIRFLFGLIAICGVALGIWKICIYRSPTYGIVLYEKAPSTRSTTFRVDYNTITIRSMARNRRDGSVVIQSGNGTPLFGLAPDIGTMTSCAAWLDVVQLEISPGPDLCEIVEVKIFDHQSRVLLSEMDQSFGWRVLEPNLIQIYGLGKAIPQQLDVWLCVHSFWDNATWHKLPPSENASVFFRTGTITISEIQDGFAGWSSRTGFYPVSNEHLGTTALILDMSPNERRGRFLLTAVAKNGEKQFLNRWLAFADNQERRDIATFNYRLSEIDHFEIWPYQERQRFFYEAVEVPQSGGGAFAAAPIVKIPIAQTETEISLPEFDPLKIRVSIQKGDCLGGSLSNSNFARLTLRSDPQEIEEATTLSYHIYGIPKHSFSFRFIDSQTGKTSVESKLGSRSTYSCFGNNCAAWGQSIQIPLDRIEAVETTLTPTP